MDFDDFLNASEDEEDQHLAKKAPKKGGSPSYRGAGHYDGHVNYGFSRRSGDPYAFDVPDHVPKVKKPKASASSAGLTKADKSLEKTLSSKMLPEKASRRKGEKTPSAKSEPARFVTSPSNRSDSESSGKGQSDGGEAVSDFAKWKADIDQLRESSEEFKRQEEEREKKRAEEARKKEEEEAKKKEEDARKKEEEQRKREEEARKKEEDAQKAEERKKEEEARREAERKAAEAKEKENQVREQQKREEEEKEAVRKAEEEKRAKAAEEEQARRREEARQREEEQRAEDARREERERAWEQEQRDREAREKEEARKEARRQEEMIERQREEKRQQERLAEIRQQEMELQTRLQQERREEARKAKEEDEQKLEQLKLEVCEREIRGLQKKLILLEEFNTELVKLKSSAESEALEMEQRLKQSKSENLQLQEQLVHAAQQTAESTSAQTELSERVALLSLDCSKLREERDALREDLALLGGHSELPLDSKQLRQDLEMTEKMLRACEKENENLAQQNRQLRQGAKLHKEEVDGRQLQLVAELNAAKAQAESNPASMRRLAELEVDLQASKEMVLEQTRELERCRENKRLLERELRAPKESEHASEVQAMEKEMKEMKEKLRYYACSQQQMDEDRRRVAELTQELRQVREQSEQLKRRPGLKEASRRLTELRRHNEELQECLRKRHPDGILSMLKACEAPVESNEERQLERKVQDLTAQLAEKDELYDRQMRALRAQYDHLRHRYEQRIEAPVKVEVEERRVGPDHEAVLQARIKDLERQVEHTKSYYLTKLRKREPLVPPPTKSNRQVQQLQQQLQEREQRIQLLESKLSASPRLPPAPGAPGPRPEQWRHFLGFSEAAALQALCGAQRCLAQAVRAERPLELLAQLELMLPTLSALEASQPRPGELLGAPLPPEDGGMLPSSVWGAWRVALQRLHGLARANRPKQQLLAALQELRMAAEAVIEKLFDPSCNLQGAAGLERMAPRISLEVVREELDGLDSEVALRLLQAAEARAGLDDRLPWPELLAVLAECGISKHCLELCESAAPAGFTVSLVELRRLLQGAESEAYAPLFQTLARIRVTLSRDPTALPRIGDSTGFVARGDFMEALRSLPCALSLEERHQIAALFCPAGDARRVCYPLFLQSVVPESLEVQAPVAAPLDGRRLEEAEAECRSLREQLRQQEARSAEQAREIAALGAEAPAQAVRRLQGEVALLESKVLEQQAVQVAAARKAEITLRAELDVKSHEVGSLQRALDMRNAEVRRYQAELEAIIAELNDLRARG